MKLLAKFVAHLKRHFANRGEIYSHSKRALLKRETRLLLIRHCSLSLAQQQSGVGPIHDDIGLTNMKLDSSSLFSIVQVISHTL